MNNWCEYWKNSRPVAISKAGGYRLIKENDTLDFYRDLRDGRTKGMIFLFSAPGTKGSTMARGEEASFLEDILSRL